MRTRNLTTLQPSMENQGPKVYKVYINDDTWFTMTNFTAMSNLGKFAFCVFSRPIYQMGVYRSSGYFLYSEFDNKVFCSVLY